MYVSRSLWYPIPGKENELRQLGEEYARDRQARGEAVSLTERLYSPIGSVLTLAIRVNDLAEIEKRAAANRTDATFQAALAKAHALTRAPATGELREVLVAPNARARPVKYVQHVVVYPALGKGPELRGVLTERVQMTSERARVGLAIQLFGAEGTVLVVTRLHESMAEYDESRRANRDNASFQQYASRVVSLSRKDPDTELHEIVVPFPTT